MTALPPAPATDRVRVDRVGVVGAGRVGVGVAEVSARAHVDVLVWESTKELAAAGRRRLEASLDRGVSVGEITEREREQALSRLRFTTDLSGLADRELVVEAVVEDVTVKSDLLRRLDAVVVAPDAVLSTTTSSIPIATLARCTAAPQRVVGLHFLHPVAVLPLVELVTCPETSEATRDRAAGFAEVVLGKQVVHAGDRPGFLVNGLLVPFLFSAIRMVESGYASVEDVDTAMVLGCDHPVGPLALADDIGLDTVRAVGEAMYSATGQAHVEPPSSLVAMVEAGCTGRRAGRGFYRYDAGGRMAREVGYPSRDGTR